ncbi:MAG: hypothetical protein A2093_10445 [Caulobacterales bacterium GWE1_67_11]|nr:MAG: hypothetical protein A2093_10445 [Caulobacterales bacterium GWE1_67_11]OHC51288.1 MAG: hypothetical protein A2X69_05425 [Rhodobacteraceae bacterium GWF1_65_7]HBD90276.1 metallopeptidase [Gemmobacter sp.]HBU14422.1 metallopeptidase [Gemmobacter sp.]
MCLLCLMSTAGTPDPIPAAGREVSDYTALLAYLDYSWGRWNATERLRTPVIVSYTFTETADLPSLAEFDPYGSDGYFSFNADQRDAFRQAAEILEKMAGVVMVEKPGAEAMINVFNSDGSQWSGWANYPSVSEYGSSGGNLVLDYPAGTNYRPGTDAFQVMLHELGHAMGLKHPFEGSVQLIDRFDNTYNTLMSYDWSGGTKSGFSHLDVDALTHLYGTQANTTGWRMSWGADEFRLTASGRAEFLITLPNERNVVRAAGGNDTVLGGSEADRIWGQSGHDTLRGAYGDDKIYGGAGADRLEGGHGSDTLLGGAGADKLSNGTADAQTYGDSDILRGEAGNDRLAQFGSTANLYGGAGNDTLTATGANVRVFGDGGADVIVIRDSSAEIWGGAGDDILRLDGYDATLRYDAPNQSGRDKVFGFDIYGDQIAFGSRYDATDLSFSRAAGGKLLLEIGKTAILFADLRFAEATSLQIDFA